jgi:4-amino-4-deoxy-L-arabinose transferase-like glycosyltransferase
MALQTSADDGSRVSWNSPAAAVGLLVALAVPLFFVKLGSAGLVDPDEPYYAVPALEMLKSGTWSVPIFRGQPWFDKPILFYWIILAAFKAFGASEWAARIGSALAGLGGAVAVATLSPAGWRRGGAHVLAAVVLATSLEYAFLSRSAVTDMTLTLFLTLGFLAVALHLESGGLLAAAGAGAAFGLATLTKGPVGVIVPAVALAGYGLATRRRELLRAKSVAVFSAGFLATAAPWYAYMVAAHRDLVVKVFLGEENLGRFVNPEHRQFPLFYVAVLAAGLMPWSAALPAGLARAFRAARRGDERPGASPGPVYALFWFAGVLGVFSLSASKLLTYILPAFPAAAFLIADYWGHALAPRPLGERLPPGPLAVAWTSAGISLAAAGAILVLARGGRVADGETALYAMAAALTAAAFAAIVAVRFLRLAIFAAVQAASTVAIVLVFVVFVWPGLEASESTKTVVRRLAAGGLADQLVGAYRVPDVSLEFYLGRALARETDPLALARLVSSDPGRLWIVRADEVDGMIQRLPLGVERVLTVSRHAIVRLSPGIAGGGREGGS